MTAEDDGAALPPAVESLPANEVGVAEAAMVGETAVSSDWQITLLDGVERPAADPGLILVQIGYTGSPPGRRPAAHLSAKRTVSGRGGQSGGG